MQPPPGSVRPAAATATAADAPTTCSEKASTVVEKIKEGQGKLDKMIGEMGKRIRTHKDISERVLAMKTELENLKKSQENIGAETADAIAKKEEALESINLCTANVNDMEKAMGGLLDTIEELKQQIETQDSEYDLTDTRLKDAGFPPRLDGRFD
jgi:chromosome segregation ATPase